MSDNINIEEFDDLPAMPDDEPYEIKARPILEEVHSHRQYKIPSYPMFIGRDRKGSVCIPLTAVSRRHAKVFERDGVFYIQDAGSINGTFVNDKRVVDPVELNEGDRIKIAITKQYPRGAKELVFKYDISEQERIDQAKKKERDQLLAEVGITFDKSKKEREGIPLRHCLCYISKKDLVSVLTSNSPRRVPIEKIDLDNEHVEFFSLFPYRVKDSLMLSIKHQRLATPITMLLKITEISEQPHHGILLNKATITKMSDREKELFRTQLVPEPLICYVNCKIKE